MAARTPRSQVIGAFVMQAVTASGMKWNVYAARVVEHYHAAVDVTDRGVSFHVATTADDFDNAQRLNTQTVKRVLTGEIRMHADLEESLVAALDPADRERLQTRLLARSGLLYARQPGEGEGGDLVGPCELMRRAADAVQRIAPMLCDMRITADDAPHFADAEEALGKVMGACVTVTTQIALARSGAAAATECSAKPLKIEIRPIPAMSGRQGQEL